MHHCGSQATACNAWVVACWRLSILSSLTLRQHSAAACCRCNLWYGVQLGLLLLLLLQHSMRMLYLLQYMMSALYSAAYTCGRMQPNTGTMHRYLYSANAVLEHMFF
jgi:hypothetical protein